MESEDPYRDFRLSMEEMVVAHGLRDWERLEELLVWYLRVNGKKTHGFIVGAFVDLLAGLASPLPPSFSPSKSMEMEEIKEEEGSRSS
ncbi:atofp18 ofp18 [Musa troglodytarum]|nr:atofp18 ofp18 [Musa troglodytarum]